VPKVRATLESIAKNGSPSLRSRSRKLLKEFSAKKMQESPTGTGNGSFRVPQSA